MRKMRMLIGMALAIAGLAIGGVMLMTGSQAAEASAAVPGVWCRYKVIVDDAKIHLSPRNESPVVGTWQKGHTFTGTASTTNGFVGNSPVSSLRIFGWVAMLDVQKLHCFKFPPKGGVAAGGGGTVGEAGPQLPAAGLGLIMLGSGIALATWRRRNKEAVQNT